MAKFPTIPNSGGIDWTAAGDRCLAEINAKRIRLNMSPYKVGDPDIETITALRSIAESLRAILGEMVAFRHGR